METYAWEPEDTFAEYLLDNGEKVLFARWCSVLQELLTGTNWGVIMPPGNTKIHLTDVEKGITLIFPDQVIYERELTPAKTLVEAKTWAWAQGAREELK
jgi:hypothetical protein